MKFANAEFCLAALQSIVESETNLAWNGYRAGFEAEAEFVTKRAESERRHGEWFRLSPAILDFIAKRKNE